MFMISLPDLSRRLAPLALLCACCASLQAVDLATWQEGIGQIGTGPATAGATIADGVVVAANGRAPARLSLLTGPNSIVTLGAGASLSIKVEEAAGAKHLVLSLLSGAIEVSLGNKGPYQDVIVRGAAMNVRVTGTLFVVERVRKDADYVALVNGHVKVGLRRDVAEALGKPGEEVDLQQHQGLAATTGAGLGVTEGLSHRPSVSDSSHTIHDQSTTGSGGWGNGDSPEVLGQAASSGAGSTNGPNTGIDSSGINGNPSGAPPPGSPGAGGANPLTLTIQNDINNQIFQGLDHGSLGQQILETTLSPGPLSAPPHPPH
jgi:hypothetical protein